jgi:hypothetical protein
VHPLPTRTPLKKKMVVTAVNKKEVRIIPYLINTAIKFQPFSIFINVTGVLTT